MEMEGIGKEGRMGQTTLGKEWTEGQVGQTTLHVGSKFLFKIL